MTRDLEGNVLSITTTEPRFTRREKAILLASRRQVRGTHGILMSDAMDPKNQFAFVTDPPAMDWAQKTLTEAKETYRKANPDADLSAVHIRVRRRDAS